MRKERHSSQSSSLLSTVLARSRGEHGDEFAVQSASGPEAAAPIKEGRDLRGDAAVTGRSAQNETVDLLQGVGGEEGVLGLEGAAGVHLGEDRLGEGLLTVWSVICVQVGKARIPA